MQELQEAGQAHTPHAHRHQLAEPWLSPGSPQCETVISSLSPPHLFMGLPLSVLAPPAYEPSSLWCWPLVPALWEGGHLALLHWAREMGSTSLRKSSETEFEGKTGKAMLVGHVDRAGLKQHRPHFSCFTSIFFCLFLPGTLLPCFHHLCSLL